MSYDIHLYMEIDTGGDEPADITLADVGNYTSNVAPMWAEALGHSLSEFKDQIAGSCLPALARAIADMETRWEYYRDMNPPNGWGNVDGALEYLRDLHAACTAHPKATIYISH